MESPNYLFIGEAKHESEFNSDGTVLVHQLIRQYVLARILVDHKNKEKQVVPFVVVDKANLNNVMNTAQIRFMTSQQDVVPPDGTGRKWMSKDNVLTWEQIKELWP